MAQLHDLIMEISSLKVRLVIHQLVLSSVAGLTAVHIVVQSDEFEFSGNGQGAVI